MAKHVGNTGIKHGQINIQYNWESNSECRNEVTIPHVKGTSKQEILKKCAQMGWEN
jgi:hypothetical protein